MKLKAIKDITFESSVSSLTIDNRNMENKPPSLKKNPEREFNNLPKPEALAKRHNLKPIEHQELHNGKPDSSTHSLIGKTSLNDL